jgi:hypothetical protein
MLLLVALGTILGESWAAQPPAARTRRTTVLGTVYDVDPRFDQLIAGNIARARKVIGEQRAQGKFIAYVSVMISKRGGSHEATNLKIAAQVKDQLETRYGRDRFYALNPGEFQMGAVAGEEPQGGDFLYMWTEILAGTDGKGSDFDFVYFVGPSDVHQFFGDPQHGILDNVEARVDLWAKNDDRFRREVAAHPESRRAFVRFYGLRAGMHFSKGAHDEWNIFVRLNRHLGVGNQIPLYYDGRALSPAEMEVPVAPGYEIPVK